MSPACVTVKVGDPVGPAVKAVAPEEIIVVLPPETAVRAEEVMVNPAIDPEEIVKAPVRVNTLSVVLYVILSPALSPKKKP